MGDEYGYAPSAAKSGPLGQPDEREARGVRQSAEYWAEAVRETPLNRLRYYDALCARPGYLDDPGQREKIKARIGELIRETDPAAILGDPHLVTMVRWLFTEKGLVRLRERAKQTHKGVVANMADSLHQRGAV